MAEDKKHIQTFKKQGIYHNDKSDNTTSDKATSPIPISRKVRAGDPFTINHNLELPLRPSIPLRTSVASHKSTPSGSPDSPRSLWGSPCRRSHCSLEELLSSSPPAHKAHLLRVPSNVARDATQPASGDLSSSTDKIDSEEREDSVGLAPLSRPRSSTCPESRAWKRRRELKVRRRPASPPAVGVEVSILSQQLASMAMKQHLHIPDRDLPQLEEIDKGD